MSSFPVKYIHNAMRGAPKLSGTPGAFIAVLDAFFVTGFGLVTAQSVTVAGGIATATLNAGDTFATYCVVQVAGATPEALNGEARVLSATNTSITWATTAPDGPASGTITIKVAPVGGWEKAFSGTNKAAYRSTAPGASGFYWRVDDSGTIAARVCGFEAMTDVDTGTGPFPTDAQIQGGGYQWKSGSANATAVRYDLVADSRTVLVAIAPGSSESATSIASPIRGFGDMIALAPGGDGFAVVLSCSESASGESSFRNGTFDFAASGKSAVYIARHLGGIGGGNPTGTWTYVGSSANSNISVSGVDGTLGAFPSAVDGQLKYSRRYVGAGGGSTPRADIPGVLHVPQSGVQAAIQPRDTLAGTGDVAGRKLLALGAAGNSHYFPHAGIALVDITGPWR